MTTVQKLESVKTWVGSVLFTMDFKFKFFLNVTLLVLANKFPEEQFVKETKQNKKAYGIIMYITWTLLRRYWINLCGHGDGVLQNVTIKSKEVTVLQFYYGILNDHILMVVRKD